MHHTKEKIFLQKQKVQEEELQIKLKEKNLKEETMQTYIKTSPGRILLNQSLEYSH